MTKSTEYYINALARNVKKLRLSKGLTIFELSNLTGLNEEELNRIEEEKADPYVTDLISITKVFNVEFNELIK